MKVGVASFSKFARGVTTKGRKWASRGGVRRLSTSNEGLRNVSKCLSKTLTREKNEFIQNHLVVGYALQVGASSLKVH